MRLMKNILLLLFFLPLNSWCQNNSLHESVLEDNSVLKNDSCISLICFVEEQGYLVNGIFFKLDSNVSNVYWNYCDRVQKLYIVNGFPLRETEFMNLNLKKREIVKNSTFFQPFVSGFHDTHCIDSIAFYIDITLPISVKPIGVTYKNDAINNLTIKEVYRNRRLLANDELVIQIEQ